MRSLILLLITCTVVIAQQAPETRQKYGTPVSETYMLRPGIYVTVVRGSHGTVCGLKVSPVAQSGYLLAKRYGTDISYDLLEKVVKELIPLNQRGKLVRYEILNTNCLDVGWANQTCEGNGDLFSYEKVTIFFARSDSKKKKQYAEIRWNQSECGN